MNKPTAAGVPPVMKTRILGLALAAVAVAAVSARAYDPRAGERPPVHTAERSGRTVERLVGEPTGQRLHAPGATLIAPEKASEIVGRFREAYARVGGLRIVLAVNRELVEAGTGLQLTGRTERVESSREEYVGALVPTGERAAAPGMQVNVSVGGPAGGAPGERPLAKGEATERTESVVADNVYTHTPRPALRLADRQTVRDLERLFGRPLRAGGAVLVDQRVVASLLEDAPLDRFLSGGDEAARKDRAALATSADAVLEILVSSRALNVPGLAEDRTYDVPDIQATLVRLKDGVILAQASSVDVLGKDRYAGPIVRNFDVNDIAEATALALMEDFAATVP